MALAAWSTLPAVGIEPTLRLAVRALHLRDSFHVLGRKWIGASITRHIMRVKVYHILLARRGVVIAMESTRVCLLVVVSAAIHISIRIGPLRDICQIDATNVAMARAAVLTAHHYHRIELVCLIDLCILATIVSPCTQHHLLI